MSSTPIPSIPYADANQAEPSWDVARLFPAQGHWSESEYLRLTQSTNWLVELTDGHVEVLPMPTTMHQLIVKFLLRVWDELLADGHRGIVASAPLRMKISNNRFREPDILLMLSPHSDRVHQEYWDGADLVMEVVSEDEKSRQRDLVEKRAEYAQAGIPEYWIVDPHQKTISVLWLADGQYATHGQFAAGDMATSKLLPEFCLAVRDVFAAGMVPGGTSGDA